MTQKLVLRQYIDLPYHSQGDFDHGDVLLSNGYVFIANTAAGTVEVVDGEHLRHLVTIPGCPEASGVLAAQDDALIFAAARGAGKLLMIDAMSATVIRTVAVGSRPNGLAWDSLRKRLLVADVKDNTARLVDSQIGQVIATVSLPGRPRWAVYHPTGDRFLVNIREPALVAVISALTFELSGQFPVSRIGPHGLDLDPEGRRAFVACDGGTVVTLDISKGLELAQVGISGTPDAIWHNHRAARLYVTIQDPGAIDVVNTETMIVEEQIFTELGTRTSAFDPRRQRLYVFLPSCRVAMYEESEVA
jgi:DNA-binding beta-propeller fold protein YncE